ncbi:hypothetical protein A2Z53_02675 [Candidatus Giovannonibacteria bacterium RIFCSPHIGHO2_02_42_15]|uniref:Uncharacterized protein n=1 Tax=Candidatus Giovannonibacteria bacterium RIFCSPHIGHO2_02_42_15 TaxID=1798329 RepID=A0A1F5VPT1_9BACT|nr:MAG: hypothetical protein A2Z53_02675 [Candidatus Giovannonibacteria bacterium RIFCSPHIGHO2_02_42_15]
MNWFKIIKEYIHNRPKIKKVVAVILVLAGLAAFFTPLTPGSWLAIIGLELLGARILLFDKFKFWKKK